jgi:hypothetical protein
MGIAININLDLGDLSPISEQCVLEFANIPHLDSEY